MTCFEPIKYSYAIAVNVCLRARQAAVICWILISVGFATHASDFTPSRCLQAFTIWSAEQVKAINTGKSQRLFQQVFVKKKSINFAEYEISVGEWNAFLEAFRNKGNFTTEQSEALFLYHFNSGRFNPRLRSDELGSAAKYHIKILDSMFSFGLLEEGTILLRGTNGLNLKKGKVFSDPAPLSVTIRPKVARYFAKIMEERVPQILMIRIPKGGYPALIPLMLPTSKSMKLDTELEIVLPRNSKIKILDVTVENGILIYRGELLAN